MARHPYLDLPDTAYWRRGVVAAPAGALYPTVDSPFRLDPRDKVATAGSCFAQHIGRYLKAVGSTFLVTEPAHPLVSAEAERLTNYGIFSARYGNVYTARQLLQLFDRAYGRFHPSEDMWIERPGMVLDPFRPNIQPLGFNSQREFALDRARHFRGVREAFEKLDVFVFTLGLTEGWRSRRDGAVFPVCPGVSGGTFDPGAHEFVNFEVDDIVADMTAFIERLRSVNRQARVILTVSPVPLAATAEKRHVLVSTVYSKSVLRVACDMLARRVPNVAYFPSYEIVSSGFAGHYFAADMRSVTEEGVAHVMRAFSQQFMPRAGAGEGSLGSLVRRAVQTIVKGAPPARDAEAAGLQAAFQVMCDEEALDIPAAAEPVRTDPL